MWTCSGQGGTESQQARIEPADSSLKWKLEKSPWHEQTLPNDNQEQLKQMEGDHFTTLRKYTEWGNLLLDSKAGEQC